MFELELTQNMRDTIMLFGGLFMGGTFMWADMKLRGWIPKREADRMTEVIDKQNRIIVAYYKLHGKQGGYDAKNSVS